MKRKISPNDCKSMFSDKLTSLSMKELGIELKHFAIGTAPESPSYLVNQEELKKLLIDKFANFFDPVHSQGLEVIFLKSNYGNGKSHFIRTIHTFLNNYENVLAKKVSLKQEKTDLKIKILEGIGQKVIKDSATFFVNAASEKSLAFEKEAILLTLGEDHDINSVLSELLFQAAKSEQISKQAQAIAILKGNYLNAYLKTFNLKRSDLNSEFYFNVIKLICDYLYKSEYYLVIVFDEYEHVYSWKDAQARKLFFEDIKLFTDSIDTYKNLFFVFAESESVDNDPEASDDPAYVSRKKGRTFKIENISSEAEVIKLFKMIRSRYEKYYEISFDEYVEEILEAINNDPQVKANSNYRTYTQVIMRCLDQFRNSPPKAKKNKKCISRVVREEYGKDEKVIDGSIDLKSKWTAATSISRKTLLCEALEYILEHSTEKIISRSKKKGIYQSQKDAKTIEYHIIATEKPSSADFIKRYNEALKVQEESEVSECIILYPYKDGINDEFKYENVIFYDVENIPYKLEQIYAIKDQIGEVISCLQALKVGC